MSLVLALGSCLLTTSNLFHLTLAAELSWVALYTLAGVFGVFIDEAGCFSLTFFILGFAAVELCFGLLILLLMRHFKLSIFLPANHKAVATKLFYSLNYAATTKKKN
jgi:hypothetical protein